SAAAEAGLRPGDVVTGVGGRPVRSVQDFLNIEGHLPVGEAVDIDYLRDGRRTSASVRLDPLPVVSGGALDQRLEGARFTELPHTLRSEGVAGVLLSELDPRSRLALAGLREGDVVTGINRRRVNDLGDFEALMQGLRGPIMLQIRRNGRAYLARVD
ncbi:MAG: PDZ domain-containing protein, partial [Xanthomonadales bacterium]|nr:PDZ domain-containing protein [Xanthomonadales bacterium]